MSIDTTVVRYTLDPSEVGAIREVVSEVRETGATPREPSFYDKHWALHRRLPRGLRDLLDDFRRGETASACLVDGFPAEDQSIGATPADWDQALQSTAMQEQEVFIAMCALALGEPYTWSTLQKSAMIQNLMPIRGDEKRQNGHSSDVLLEFHTEDGFHPARCDYLLLFGMRNHDHVPTYMASIRDVRLTDECVRILSEPRFLILPDDEHVRQLKLSHPDHPALTRALEMRESPEPVAVLFGDRLNPYLRIDPPFMRCQEGDAEAEEALGTLMLELERNLRSVVVEQGSLLIVDNYLAVHGRKAFRSRYDGTDRWLKRMIVSRDLRKTADRHMRTSARVLF